MLERGEGLAAENAAGAGWGAHPAGMSTAVPGGIGGTHPGRSSCVRNVVTPVEVRPVLAGKPTARKAQSLGGNLMAEKRNAGSRKATGNLGVMVGLLRLAVRDNRPDTGRKCPDAKAC
jgi:hypothetical protein